MRVDKEYPTLSIIIPVYKAEEFLPECIESVLKQTFKDFELILVNDGSPDKCEEICRSYADLDRRINVISKKTGEPAQLEMQAWIVPEEDTSAGWMLMIELHLICIVH